MRVSIDLTDEALRAAQAIARERNTSLGKAVSDLVLQNASLTGARSAAGFPLFASGQRRTAEDVRVLLDE